MTPEQFLQTVSAVMLKNPPPGLSRAYINAFLRRNRAGLLTAIRRQFDQLCRPDALIKGYEQKIGFAVLPPEDIGQQAVFGRDIGTQSTTFLAVKARCHPADPVRARQYAVHSKRADEKGWKIHPGEEWHGSEEAAIIAFAQAHAHEARWLVHDSDAEWSGVRDAPYVLADSLAVRVAKERLEEVAEERVRAERVAARQLENHQQMMKTTAARQIVQEPSKAIPESQPVQPAAPVPDSAPEEPTLWGGRRGAIIPPESVQKGMRVVTPRGEHGIVEKVDIAVWTIADMTSWGARTTEKRTEKSYTFILRLDSGRQDTPSQVYQELAPPRRVVPDVVLENGAPVSPSDAWRAVQRIHRNIDFLLKKAADARKPLNKAQYSEQAEEQRVAFQRVFQRFHSWREENSSGLIDDFDPYQYRLLTFEAGIRPEGWQAEWRWLKATPKDWRTRFVVGEAVIRPTFEPSGQVVETRDRILRLEGADAILESDEARIPLYLLRSAPDVASSVPTYTEGMWLVNLGRSLLADSYMGRAPAAVAIKAYLADRGIDVRTRVDTGANMNGVTLTPPGKFWSDDEVARMNGLLHLGARRDEVRIHPTATEGEESNWSIDYAGRPSGVWLEPARIPEFAPYLAKALKDAGQSLSRTGEAWLARASRRGEPVGQPAGGTRNGATADQRAAASGGCRDLSFQLAGYGTVRVVCGAKGRRDVWHNISYEGKRFGFNGGRWARGQVPETLVLDAIRQRGITAFDGGIERLAAASSEDGLDPVVRWTLEQGGIRPDQLPLLGEVPRRRTRLIPGMVRPDGLTFRALGERWQEREEDGLRGFDPEAIFLELYEFMLAESRIENPLSLDDEHDEELLEHLPARSGRASRVERMGEPGEESHLDPVIGELVAFGGVSSDLIRDIAEELRPKARAIPGFLRPDGKDWLELARLHYEPQGAVVVEELPDDWWQRKDASYETVSGYIELIHFGLDYSFPEVRYEHYEEGELVERLCSCQRSTPAMRRAG